MFDPKALRLFLDALSDAVLVLDRSARVYHANTMAQRLFKAEAGTALAELAPLLGEPLVSATTQVLAKGVPRVGAPRPALPETLSFPDGRRFGVVLLPLEGERWALRLSGEPEHNGASATPGRRRPPSMSKPNWSACSGSRRSPPTCRTAISASCR